jgi:hypothetical protein
VMRSATFVAERNFGFTDFDWVGSAIFVVFQTATLEGWSDLLYLVRRWVLSMSGFTLLAHR